MRVGAGARARYLSDVFRRRVPARRRPRAAAVPWFFSQRSEGAKAAGAPRMAFGTRVRTSSHASLILLNSGGPACARAMIVRADVV